VVFKLAGAVAAVDLGEHVFVGRGTLFDLTGRLTIGAGTMLAPYCFVTDHNHGTAPGTPMWRQLPVELSSSSRPPACRGSRRFAARCARCCRPRRAAPPGARAT
jgi:hypothetical protein